MKLLSILICSLYRRKDFLDTLNAKLLPQCNDLVEVLYGIDGGEYSIGSKRNTLLDRSAGKYVCFVDDDDMVSDHYVEKILEGLVMNVDVIGMHLIMTTDGGNPQHSYHSIKYRHWYDEPDPVYGKRIYYRNPNHLNPVRREFALSARFPEINYQEDLSYSTKLLQYLTTEHNIVDPIYFYQWRTSKDD